MPSRSRSSSDAYRYAPEAQAWLATYGRGQLNDALLFFPIDARNHLPR